MHTLGMHYLLTMHLLQNVVLAEWAPLLVVLGDTAGAGGGDRRPGVVRAVTHLRSPSDVARELHGLAPPVALRRRARDPNALLHLEHAMYFATGVAMWWCVFQDQPHRLGAGLAAAYVFAAFVLASPIGLVIALVPNAIYDFYVHAHHRSGASTPLGDQQLGGMLMAVEQAVVFFAVFAYWFFRFLAEEERRGGR